MHTPPRSRPTSVHIQNIQELMHKRRISVIHALPPPKNCHPLFNHADSDVIIRASTVQKFDFRAHKCILSIASPFFRNMLGVESPVLEGQDLPIIPFPEEESTLEMLLQFIYPMPDPEVEFTGRLVTLLEAATKYEMQSVLASLRRILVSPRFLDMNPLQIYAIACRFRLEEEVRLASSYTLRLNVVDIPLLNEWQYVSADKYILLLQLHRARSKAARRLFDEISRPNPCPLPYCVKGWWQGYKRKAQEELSIRPSTDVIFSLEFLHCSATGCGECVLSARETLDVLKRQIDALPSTI